MFINYKTQTHVKNNIDTVVTVGTIGYLSALAVKVVVPGIVNPVNAVAYSIAGFVCYKLFEHTALNNSYGKAICATAAFGICHLLGSPVSVPAALALTSASLIWNKVFSGGFV